MHAPSPLAILLAAPPTAAGGREALARAATQAAAGRAVRVLLSAEGLAWAQPEHRAALAAMADVVVCSRNAREAGWSAEDTPAGVGWSSVATWLAQLDAEGPAALWAVLP